jgi:hypothetical protein
MGYNYQIKLPMDKRDVKQKQKIMEGRLHDVKTTLLKIPNVVAVGIGFKESGKKFTEEISYRVFVPEKKGLTDLRPDEIIPASINGIPTDVLTPYVVVNDSDVCGDERRTLSKKRPLQAGIAVSTDSTSYGTLGWFGTLADSSVVLLTNKHVLYDETNTTDSSVRKTAQPQLGDPSTCCCCTCGDDNAIGESIIGIRDISPASDTSVDCAIARINADFTDDIIYRITNDSTTEVLSVAGIAEAAVGDNVRKIGARSGFTRGTVIHIGDIAVAVPPDSAGTAIAVRQGQVLIIPDAAETYQVREGVCKAAFSNSGDSGAVILNGDNRIIALNWGGDRTTNNVGITIACRIQNVLDKLSSAGHVVTLSVSPSGGDAEAVKERKFRQPAAAPVVTMLEKIRDANKQSLLYWIYERHHREVMTLINHCRPVTVAWQRNQGPAYVAALTRASREPAYFIPFTINGISRDTLLKKLETVLLENGSELLKSDIKKFRDDLMTTANSGQTIEEVAEALKAAGLIDIIPSDTIPKL